MRLYFLTFIVSLLATISMVAQNASQRKPAGKTQTSITPATTTTSTKPRITTAPPKTSAERSSGSSSTSDNERPAVFPTTVIRKPASADGNLRPSATSLRNTNIARPSSPSNSPSKQAAKGVVKSNRKVAPLKTAERVNVNWMTLEQALERNKTERRKIFVDVYTDWCGWCKHMDSTTFVTPAVANYLNEHYYAVKFNAEQTSDITFKDKTYRFVKVGSRGHHELAALWLNNRLSFPTIVFLDENQNLIQPVPGYQDDTKMEAIINYFGSDSHRKTPWESYEKNFSGNDEQN